MFRFASRTLAALLTVVAASSAVAQDGGGYHVTKKIMVGTEGGWDYALADGDSHRLYVSHGTQTVVIDLDKDAVIGTVTPTKGVHGIAIAPKLGRGFTSNGADTSVTVFDLKTLATLGSVKVTGANPDAIAYDDETQRVFTFNGRGQNATVIDATKSAVVGTIDLGGRPEFAQTSGEGKVFVNIENTNEIVVIDSKKLTVTKRYPIQGCDGPSGLAYDRKHERLISVCSNQVMVVTDPESGKTLASVPICKGTDAAAYDVATSLAFASCSDGNVTVVKQDVGDKYTSLGNAATQLGSRTMALDTKTHMLYLAAAEFGPAPEPATPGGRRPRPPMVPGSFSVLVLDRK